MPTCKNCNTKFPNQIKIDGKVRNLQRRKFCLECSPFGSHNTRPFIGETDTIPKCAKCGVEGKEHFYNRVGRGENSYYSYCKKCYNEYTIQQQHDKKEYAIQLKGGKCQSCGYDKYIGALDFHHLDPSVKDSSIRFTSCSRERLVEELEHCVCVCSNCHREIHGGIIDVTDIKL